MKLTALRPEPPRPKPWFVGLTLLCCAFFAAVATAQTSAAPVKTLRLAFPSAESGFDPAQIGDNYSLSVTAQIFDGLYGYDELARPVRLKPVTALGMPEVSADFRTWTVRLKPVPCSPTIRCSKA